MDFESNSQQSYDYKRIEEAIRFIENNFQSQPSLEEIARSVHLSKYHFNRIFKRWAGISPIQFMQYLTLDYTKQKLADSRSVLDATYDAGLSGPGRLHDLFVTFEAMTPGEFKNKGSNLIISYGFCDSPFGDCLLAFTKRGICHFGFVVDNHEVAFKELTNIWSKAQFVEDSKAVDSTVKRIFKIGNKKDLPFNLHIKGTNFQFNVWKALLSIPEGWVVSYQDIASFVGAPKAFRAVASAIAVNPVAYLIPCHRVITKAGNIHQYRYGSPRKKALVGWEAARLQHESQ